MEGNTNAIRKYEKCVGDHYSIWQTLIKLLILFHFLLKIFFLAKSCLQQNEL